MLYLVVHLKNADQRERHISVFLAPQHGYIQAAHWLLLTLLDYKCFLVRSRCFPATVSLLHFLACVGKGLDLSARAHALQKLLKTVVDYPIGKVGIRLGAPESLRQHGWAALLHPGLGVQRGTEPFAPSKNVYHPSPVGAEPGSGWHRAPSNACS